MISNIMALFTLYRSFKIQAMRGQKVFEEGGDRDGWMAQTQDFLPEELVRSIIYDQVYLLREVTR